jgi:hypothetical protein
MLIFDAQEYVERALVDFVVEPPPAYQPLLRDWPLSGVAAQTSNFLRYNHPPVFLRRKSNA